MNGDDSGKTRPPYHILLVACLFPLAFCLWIGCGQSDRQFVRIEQGAFRTTLTETGELRAVRYAVVPMPHFHWDYGRPRIIQLETEGTRVEKGDVVGQIEASGVVQFRGRQETSLAIEQANLNAMLVQQAGSIADLEAKIQSAESALRLAQIDQQRTRFESETRKKVKALEFSSKALVVKKLRAQWEAMHLEQAEDLRILRAKIRKIESGIAKADETLDRFVLRAPAPGLIEYQHNRSTRNKVGVGDQLWSGALIVGLPDLSRMKAATTVGETDIDKIARDQRVRVRLDAFPKRVFEGRITDISRISRNRSQNDRRKVFDVEVLLDQSDPILRPGMTVSCEFVVADLDDVLFVRTDGIHREAGEYVVYVKQALGLKRVPVRLGPRNAQYVVILGDVKAGAQVALAPGERAT